MKSMNRSAFAHMWNPMTAFVRSGSIAAALVTTAGIATGLTSSGVAAQAPDRSQRPAAGPVPELKLPPLQQFTLGNGVRVLVIEKRDVPIVQMNLIVNAGAVSDDPAKPGIASLTADMLDEGAGNRNALEIADAFEMLGARFVVRAGLHTTTLSVRAQKDRLPEALAIVGDVVLRPTFPAAELDRIRAERLTALVRQHDQPGAISAVLFDETLFGKNHPYGRSPTGSEATLRSVTPNDLRAFWQAHWKPDNATVVVVGDVTASTIRTALDQTFGAWQRGAASPRTVSPAGQVSGRRIIVVDKPGAAQSVVRLARVGPPRSTPDYFALQVLNTILGGSFTSRLNQNLREKNGFAYGAGSSFDFRPSTGAWSAASNVQTQSTGPAVREILNELNAIREPIPQDEIDRAKNYLAMGYPSGFQSAAEIAARLADVVQYNLPLDYFNTFTQRVLAVNRADVERVARQYIDPANVTITIVGDRKVIEPQLRELGIAEIQFLNVTDVLGPVPVLNQR